MSYSNLTKRIGYFLAGASLGAVGALLLAPQSGKETREYLGNKADEGKDYLLDRSRELRRQAGEFADRSKTFVGRQRDRLADALRTT